MKGIARADAPGLRTGRARWTSTHAPVRRREIRRAARRRTASALPLSTSSAGSTPTAKRWDDATRGRNLQRVVNNSRFLILPWVRVQNLASRVLSLMARQLPCEWHSRYGVEPLLLETLVDHSRYRGTCYRAANWIELGVTTGRGRMDREHRRHGASSKTVLVLPLVKDPRRVLRES